METVIWSGGADSTYILNELAKDSSKKFPIRAISVVSKTTTKIDRQGVAERRARKKLLEIFKERGYHIQHEEVPILRRFFCGSVNHQGFLWLLGAFPALPQRGTVSFGYVFEDSIWHAKHEFIEAFNALDRLRERGESNLKISFPLEWTEKESVLKSLKKEKLLEHVWTCERPTNNLHRCGKCNKCIEYKDNR